MKYYVRNWYNGTLQIRNTQIRLIRYIRKWNLKHQDQPLSRIEIQEIDRIEYVKPVAWYKRAYYFLIGRY